MSVRDTTLAMLVILQQGGLAPGGLNFDAKVRRESIDIEDVFIAHIASMDMFARGLRVAAKIIEDGALEKMRAKRYAGYDSGIGARIESGAVSFDDLEQYALEQGEPTPRSGKQELYELVLSRYI
ncbi:MAG: hypothetical protein GF331_05100 [Chitinivibrionales bacterium]|nr:hypothetical protein [Chitinivibrionales bacterium]